MRREPRSGPAGIANDPAGPVSMREPARDAPRARASPSRRSTCTIALSGWLAAAILPGCGATPRAGEAPPDTSAARAAASPAARVPKAVEPPRVVAGAQVHEQQGVRVAFELLPAKGGGPGTGESGFREGQDAVFRVTITDASSGTGVARAHPAAWLTPQVPGEGREPLDAARAIARFLRGDRFSRPTLDLNVFYALTMNDDATVTVVDPLFGFGNSKLLTMVLLKGNAADWALSEDQARLYVSTPSSDRVAAVDTVSWAEVAAVEGLGRPTRLALQPDGHYLWAAYEEPAGSGLAAIDTMNPASVVRVPTGRGAHEIAFDGRGRYAFATNQGAGTVTAVDVRHPSRVVDIATGPAPRSIAYSGASEMIYVADAVDGSVTILSPDELAIVGRAAAAPGITQLRFSPDGRLGLALNPRANAVHILDAASGRVVQTVDTDRNPDQVVFAGTLAYVRHLDSPSVRIIPLAGLGVGDRPVSVIDFPAGQHVPSAGKPELSLADSIAPVPGDDAVLVANPSDRTIYYYKQGMSAPTGSFSNYRRTPRAVMTLDRTLRERSSGVYETVGRLGPAGDYNLAFLLDTPRIAHYFTVKIAPDPEVTKRAAAGYVVRPLDAPSTTAGLPGTIRLRITHRATGAPAASIGDVSVLAFSPGGWQRRLHAEAVAGDPGAYAASWTPPREGTYYFYAEAPSAGIKLNKNWFLTATAKESHP